MIANTLFIRLEGPMQSWGAHESKFAVRRTSKAPTRSGVIGLLCAALGVSRDLAAGEWLPALNALRMGVRVDVPGIRWWDYHTVGAKMEMRIADQKKRTKPGAMLTRREYLCDASFLVVCQGKPETIAKLATALQKPVWTPYLGRKCCPPSRPVLERLPEMHPSILSALSAVPWQKRVKQDAIPKTVECFLDWHSTPEQPEAPVNAQIWYDVPVSLEPPSHQPRFVVRHVLNLGVNGDVSVEPEPRQQQAPKPLRPRANYRNEEYRKRRSERLLHDSGLCVFCKSPATTVQHVTYRHAGGHEKIDELRSLCRLCHDAVTMIEYGEGMGMDRINPEDFGWREKIIEKRSEIVTFRSLETRRRKLAEEVVE